MMLGDVSQGRDNNFNLIRFLAAVAVLVSHAWPISRGPGSAEPLTRWLGHSLGELAVYVFFALSGFFITASFERSQSLQRFVIARAARLLPGLAVSLVFVVLVIGPIATKLPLGTYFSDPDTAQFMLRNMLLIKPQYTLPGVYTDLPYPAVEGSIWTLIHEVACYGAVVLLGFAGLLNRYATIILALAVYGILWLQPFEMHPRLIQLQNLSLPFVIGAALWLWRCHVPVSLPILIVIVGFAGLCHGTVLAFPTLVLVLAYGAIWLGYVPKGAVRRFNRLGDYSYGIYIYAFPLQGFAVWVWGPLDPFWNIALALPMVCICAAASWHWIERPALDYARTGFRPPKLLRRQL